MIVALPVHQGRISPLFDAARRSVVVRLEESLERERREILLPGSFGRTQITPLLDAGVEALVCGSISESMIHALLGSGIRVWPGAAGCVEAVIGSLLRCGALTEEFGMPGIARRRRCGNGDGKGRCLRWGWHRR